MSSIELIKVLSRVFVSASVGTVVGNVIKMNMPLKLGFREKLMTGIGAFVIGGVAENHTDKYVEELFDKISLIFQPKKVEDKVENETI